MFQEKPTVLAGHLKHTDTMPFKQHTYTPLLSTVVAHTLLNTAHTVGLRWELASALAAAIILADTAVTPPSPK